MWVGLHTRHSDKETLSLMQKQRVVLEPDSGHLDTHLHWSLSLCCFTGMSNQIHWLQWMILPCRPCTDVQSTIDLSCLEYLA